MAIRIGIPFLLLLALTGACGDGDDGSSDGPDDSCVPSKGPSCFLLIDELRADFAGAPISQFASTAKDAESTEPKSTVYGVVFADDANGDGNVDVGDKVKLCPFSNSAQSLVPNRDNVLADFNYVFEKSKWQTIWSGKCVEGAESNVSQD